MGDDKEKEKAKGLKRDKLGHKDFYEGPEAKKTTLPGQMYVHKTVSNESEFVGEKKSD